MRRSVRSFSWAVFAFCTAVGIRGQEPSQDWKEQHILAGTNRIEGFDFKRDVGQVALSLTNFSAHRDRFNPALDTHITVYFLSWRSAPFKVVAREITPSVNYWMEHGGQATRGTNRWNEWSTGVLRQAPKPIDPTNIGVVIKLNPEPSPTGSVVFLAPAILRRPGSEIVAEVSQYEATFLPDTSISELSFAVLEGCGERVGSVSVDSGAYGNQYRGRSIAIPFRVPKAGLTTLRVEYKVAGVSAPALNFCFWHVSTPGTPPQPPALG